MSDKSNRRDMDLLRKSFRALEADQQQPDEDQPRQSEPEPTPGTDDSSDTTGTVLYRGKPVKRGGLSTPGAGSSLGGSGQQFRGARSASKSKRSAGDTSTDRIKEALTTLKELYRDGLISPSEFESKKRQLLDRL